MKRTTIVLLLFPLLAPAGDAPRWQILNTEARHAAQAKDYAKLRTLLLELKPLMPGNARIAYNLAAAEARLNQADASIAELRRLAQMGLFYDLAADADFDSIRRSPEFAAIQQQMRRNQLPTASSRPAFPIAGTDLIPEDIAFDGPTHRFLISSVRTARILHPNGATFATADLSVFALRADPARRLLWATGAWVPHCKPCANSGEGKTALLAYDLDTAELKQRIESPVPGVLGDLTVSRAGDIYVSEGLHGAVVLLKHGAAAFERLDKPGEFASPQTPTLSADERTLYVPDYLRGIAALDLASRAVRWLQPSNDIALSGIDGLYLDGQGFIAVQNGVTPPRIVRLALGLQHQQVLEANTPGLGEPNHGVLVNGYFYFIANSGWGAFDDNGRRTSTPAVHSSVRVMRLGY